MPDSESALKLGKWHVTNSFYFVLKVLVWRSHLQAAFQPIVVCNCKLTKLTPFMLAIYVFLTVKNLFGWSVRLIGPYQGFLQFSEEIGSV